MKVLYIFIILFLLVGCRFDDNAIQGLIGSEDPTTNDPAPVPTPPTTIDAISFGSLSISNKTTTSFSLSLPFSGDENTNASVKLYYCNNTDTVSCNPLLVSTPMDFNKADGAYTVDITALSSPNDPLDLLNIVIHVTDQDGTNNAPVPFQLRLHKATKIYRSVGYGSTTAIDSGGASKSITINQDHVTFETAPPDNVGIGDALQYDSNGDSSVDAIAFIHQRISASEFIIKSESGDLPIQANANDEDWSLFRAYDVLSDAESGSNPNSGIDAAVNGFDSWTGGKDITVAGSDEIWHIVYYDDAVHQSSLTITGWTTGEFNYLKFMTAHTSDEVGVSQRHRGIWGTGARIQKDLTSQQDYVQFEGLSIKGVTCLFVYGANTSGKVWINDNYLFTSGTGRTIDVYNTSVVSVYVWNNIVINESASASSYNIYKNDADASIYAYNNTTVSNSGIGFKNDNSAGQGEYYIKNNIAYVVGTGFGYSGAMNEAINNISSDATLSTLTVSGTNTGNLDSQAMSFKNASEHDYHLKGDDTTAINKGVDLSSDSTLSFANDYKGTPRSTSWDIGFHEHLVGDDALTLTSITTLNIGENAFTVRAHITGDDNRDATGTLYYCNHTSVPDCDPLSGSSAVMQYKSEYFESQINDISLGEAFHSINIQVVATDPDTASGSPKLSSFSLGSNIFRSVGVTATALDSGGANSLDIASSLATFNSALNLNIGVGDVIHYDSDGDSTLDAIAFIHARNTSTLYSIKTASGNAPLDVSGDQDWQIFRAYTSLVNAESRIENTNIGVNFDNWSGEKDLVADKQSWHLALYADGEDSGSTSINGWNTSPANYFKVFTPVTASEVGVSQRHNGTYGTGYHRSSYFHINENYVTIDGISMRTDGSVRIEAFYGLGEINISNSYIHHSGTNSSRPLDFYDQGDIQGNIWNNIIISDATNTSSYAVLNNSNDTSLYIYNNTVVVNNGYGIRMSNYAGNIIKNNIVHVQGTGTAMYSFSGSIAENNSTSDNTADDNGGVGNNIGATFTFINEAADDFRLHSTDVGAINLGADLSADPYLSFDTDIQGQSRPSGANWDRGASEYVP
ncbi:MAG: hypothetical protein HOO06_01835 [Bdellovibrionaceae bacterium]|nr:hypothetical protein [Pseudobdellovibrionaceae bacterium]